MSRVLRGTLWLVCVVGSLPVQAAEEASQLSQTERWLELQRSGQQASTQPQVATPTERELAMQRWLDAQHPIPEFFEQDIEGDLGK